MKSVFHLNKFKKQSLLLFLIIIGVFACNQSLRNLPNINEPILTDKSTQLVKLENPMSVEYLQKNLSKAHPRLMLNPAIEQQLKQKLTTDKVIKNMYKAFQINAKDILNQPFLERKLVGRRLLGTSREMLYRMNILGMVYRIDKEPKILERINNELLSVCHFSDWNPSHYLDVGEMALAVAMAIDWTGTDLPMETVEVAKKALIEKGINPSFDGNDYNWWISRNNNWNQVCHAGMIAAAITIAESNPELAAKTIHRALDNMPFGLGEYGPDGVYPEGSTYWSYGTSFSVMSAAMLESAFGQDFGIAEYPAFQESAIFRVLCNAPSGWYYNYADCGDQRKNNGDLTLAWFANKTGNSLFFEEDRFLRAPEEMGKLARHAGAGLVWLAQYEVGSPSKMPTAWKGEGPNPIIIFRGAEEDPNQYYFGGKGGYGQVNHGNMDSGSFVFELKGVRWVIDPGNQNYNDLEKTGFDLWNRSQNGERWTLLTKNNFGHSTLSVNNSLHKVDGFATIIDFKNDQFPEATIDLTPTLGGTIKSAKRRFLKDSPISLVIEDNIEINEATQLVTWQLLTTAEVIKVNGGAILKQSGQELNMDILSHPDQSIYIVSLDPPPLALDRPINQLKRVEIRYSADQFSNGRGKIKVRLSG